MICLRGGLRASSKQNCRNTGMKEDVNMEQEKIVGFIASLRKEQGLTQKSLAAAVETADFSIKAVLLAGGIFSVVGFVNLMLALDTLETIGPNLAIVVLSWFYAIVISMVLLVLRARLKK
jgi:hypothetical protein